MFQCVVLMVIQVIVYVEVLRSLHKLFSWERHFWETFCKTKSSSGTLQSDRRMIFIAGFTCNEHSRPFRNNSTDLLCWSHYLKKFIVHSLALSGRIRHLFSLRVGWFANVLFDWKGKTRSAFFFKSIQSCRLMEVDVSFKSLTSAFPI